MSVLEQAPLVRSPQAESALRVIDACGCTWLFDPQRRRFRRLVKGLGGEFTIATEWRTYDRVLLDRQSDAFIVLLDYAGQRMLKGLRHAGSRCERCGGEQQPGVSGGQYSGSAGIASSAGAEMARRPASA